MQKMLRHLHNFSTCAKFFLLYYKNGRQTFALVLRNPTILNRDDLAFELADNSHLLLFQR